VLNDHSRYDPAVLAAILPGLRDLRTPLACGYIWLLNLWLWFGSRIPKAGHGNKLIDRIHDVSGTFGTPTLLAVLTFAAYLIGSITIIPYRWALVHERKTPALSGLLFQGYVLNYPGFTAKVTILIKSFFSPSGLGNSSAQQLREYTRSVIDATLDRLGKDTFEAREENIVLSEESRAEIVATPGRTTAKKDLQYELLLKQVIFEIPQVVGQALSRKKDIYDEYDRLVAEAQLRFSIALPLGALFVTAGSLLSWWITVGLISLPVLIFYGFSQLQSATTVLVQGLVNTDITAPTLDRLKSLQPLRAPAPEPSTQAT
jgi:hypothetical protein